MVATPKIGGDDQHGDPGDQAGDLFFREFGAKQREFLARQLGRLTQGIGDEAGREGARGPAIIFAAAISRCRLARFRLAGARPVSSSRGSCSVIGFTPRIIGMGAHRRVGGALARISAAAGLVSQRASAKTPRAPRRRRDEHRTLAREILRRIDHVAKAAGADIIGQVLQPERRRIDEIADMRPVVESMPGIAQGARDIPPRTAPHPPLRRCA